MIRPIFWLRLTLLAAREHLFGIKCGCGARARLPVPNGWHYGTEATGDSAWSCPECRMAGAEPVQW